MPISIERKCYPLVRSSEGGVNSGDFRGCDSTALYHLLTKVVAWVHHSPTGRQLPVDSISMLAYRILAVEIRFS